MQSLLKSLAVLACVGALAACATTTATQAGGVQTQQQVWNKVPIPEQAPAFEGYADIPNVKLWYWDTGGTGEAIVLLHPWSQSSLIWKYQQPVLAAAGYRTIALSRRGAYKSEPGPADNPGTAAGDVLMLVDRLGLTKFHLVGCAAGGVTATAFAVNNPDRLLSLMLCNSILVPNEAEWRDMFSRLQLGELGNESGGPPPEWRELGPSYRAGNPEGTRAWAELEHTSRPQGLYNGQQWGAEVTWATMANMRVPTLLMTGDGDLFAPPAMQRLFATKFPNAEVHIVDEAGHATYWEQPQEFNDTLLGWVRRHPAP